MKEYSLAEIFCEGNDRVGYGHIRRSLALAKQLEKDGDLIFWDSRLWHGTLESISKRSRWALIATLGMWWIKPSMDIVSSMNNSIYQSCTNKQKQLLGFCAIPPKNPLERNNTKCGCDYQTVRFNLVGRALC